MSAYVHEKGHVIFILSIGQRSEPKKGEIERDSITMKSRKYYRLVDNRVHTYLSTAYL